MQLSTCTPWKAIILNNIGHMYGTIIDFFFFVCLWNNCEVHFPSWMQHQKPIITSHESFIQINFPTVACSPSIFPTDDFNECIKLNKLETFEACFFLALLWPMIKLCVIATEFSRNYTPLILIELNRHDFFSLFLSFHVFAFHLEI